MQRTTHAAVLERLGTVREADDVVVATMTAGMMWPEYSRHDLDLLSMAPMGAASSVGLGVALGRPDLGVIVIDGDGSLLMNLGSLVTIGGQKPTRLLHLVMENGGYGVTGDQQLPGSGTEQIPSIAQSVGYARATRSSDLDDLSTAVADMHAGRGPILLAVPVESDFDITRLTEYLNHEGSLRAMGKVGFQNLRAGISERSVASA